MGVNSRIDPGDRAEGVPGRFGALERITEHDSPGAVFAQDSAAYDNLIGKIVANNFRIVKRIGAGAMGRVYEAEQLSLGKRVAVKILRHELMADQKILVRFQFEARAASAASHPNLVQIFDCGRDATLDLAYIGMELLSGTDLSHVIHTEWPIPLERAARIIDQVLAGLEEAHSQGIVHRDLKPGNIMLVSKRNERDFVKVCDFGIAKAESSPNHPNLTMVGLVFGTPEYMSPEQARGKPVDARTDLYAVATILYELVVGDVPFPAASSTEVLARLLRDEPERPSSRGNIHLPEALENLLMRGLSKRPEDRPQTAAQFREEFREALVGVVDHWPGSTGVVSAQGPATLPVVPPNRSPGSDPGVAALLKAPPAQPVVPSEAYQLRPRSRAWIWALCGGLTLVVALLEPQYHWRAWLGGYVGRKDATTSSVVTGIRPTSEPRVVPLRGSAPRPPVAPPSLSATQAQDTQPNSQTNSQTNSPIIAQINDQTPPSAVGPDDTTIETGTGQSIRATRSSPSKKVGTHNRVASHPGGHVGVLDRGIASAARRESGEAPSEGQPNPSQPVIASVPVEAPSSAATAGTSPPAVVASAGSVSTDLMKEAERLLGEGEVVRACSKGEEFRRVNPSSPLVYKFLGKCYMRAGKPKPASDNYRRYLQLSPDAPDAAFIKSYVK